jgi:hypothetical protein
MPHFRQRALRRIRMAHHRERELHKAAGRFREQGQPAVAFEQLDDGGQTHGAEQPPGSGARSFPGANDLGAGHAFRPRKAGFHAKWPTQRNHEKHAEQAPGEQDQRGFSVVGAEVGPQLLIAGARKSKRGNGKDGAGHQCLAHRSRRASDVLLEDAAVQQAGTKRGQRDHRSRDGGCDRLAGLHPQVCVGGPEDEREQQSESDSFDRELRRFARSRGAHKLRA